MYLKKVENIPVQNTELAEFLHYYLKYFQNAQIDSSDIRIVISYEPILNLLVVAHIISPAKVKLSFLIHVI